MFQVPGAPQTVAVAVGVKVGVRVAVTVGVRVAVAVGVHDDHEADQAERAHAGTVYELVDYQLLCEDAGAQAVGRTCHDVGRGGFEA